MNALNTMLVYIEKHGGTLLNHKAYGSLFNEALIEQQRYNETIDDLRSGLSECQGMLVEMVNQYCRNHSDDPTTYSHDFMSTGEGVFEYLVSHGLAEYCINGVDIYFPKSPE